MRALAEYRIPFRAPAGTLLAHVALTPETNAENEATAPLVEVDESDAREHGETVVQLREAECYEYELQPEGGVDLRLRCSQAIRRRNLVDASAGTSRGRGG